MNFYQFKKGKDDYRPIALWSWNHRLEEDEICWQIEQMKQQGLGGFIMHPRSGLLTPYLSKSFMDIVEIAVKKADELCLKAWLYDEDPYPSGVAGGKVVADHPEFRAKSIDAKEITVTGPTKVVLDIPLAEIFAALAVRVEDGKIVERIDLTEHMGTVRMDWFFSKNYNTYYPTTYTRAMPQNRSDAENPFYRLEWEAPAGEWTVIVFYTSWCGKYSVYPSYTDLLNPEAVRYFIDITYERYKKRLSRYFGNTIPGIFIDEPKYISDPYPWTQKLPEYFLKKKGYDILDSLLAMRLVLNDSPRLIKDFWEVVGELFNHSFTLQVRKWCEENGLMVIGHSSPEEEPADQVLYTGDLMQFVKNLHMAGTDLITYILGDKRAPIVNLGPKLAASVARQWKDGKVMSESFGVMEWRLKLSDMIYFTNWMFSLGVNIIVPHTFIYSIDGPRKMDAGPSEFYQMPYYRYFYKYSDYLASIGCLLGDSESASETALVYPFDSFMSLRVGWVDDCKMYRDYFTAVFDKLVRSHVQFDLVDYSDFIKAPVMEGRMVVGKKGYKHVVVPPLKYLATEMYHQIKTLEVGEIDVTVGEINGDGFKRGCYIEDALIGKEINFINEYKVLGEAKTGFGFYNFEEVLDRCRPPVEFRGITLESITLYHVKNEDNNIFFVSNLTDKPLYPEVFLSISGCVELWDTDVDEPVAVDRENGFHALIPGKGAIIIVVAAKEGIKSNLNMQSYRERVGVCWNEWKLARRNLNTLLLDQWSVSIGKGDVSHIDYAYEKNLRSPCSAKELNITHYPETILYKTAFHVENRIPELSLIRDLSSVRGSYEIFINGHLLEDGFKDRVYDCNNFVHPLVNLDWNKDSFYTGGEVTVAVKVKACCDTDGLVEPLRIFGDFTAWLNENTCLDANLVPCSGEETINPGSLTYQGYPHYAGTVQYTNEFTMDAVDRAACYFISLDTGGDAVELYLNSEFVKTLVKYPFEAEITNYVKTGTNRIELLVSGTLENMLYNNRKPFGLLGECKITKRRKYGL